MVNYYELLGVSQDADIASIKQAIKKTRRLWNNRANSPDATIRAEAERHVREIAEAEKILLDESSRNEYNRNLIQGTGSSPQNTAENNDSWEDEYFQAYDRDLNDYAAQIAQRAISANDRNGRAWFLYGEALRRGGRNRESITAFQRASMLLPNDSNPYRQMGIAYMGEDDSEGAIHAFSNAIKIAPHLADLYMWRAKVYRIIGMIDSAKSDAAAAHNIDPDDNEVKLEYFLALVNDAFRAMSYNRSSGKHLIISKKQLDYVNTLLEEIALTIPEGEYEAECKKYMEEIVSCVSEAEYLKPGGFFSLPKYGYEINYEKSNADTRSSGLQ